MALATENYEMIVPAKPACPPRLVFAILSPLSFAAFLLASVGSAFALDLDGDGVSDVYAQHHKLPPGSADEDTDHDGWSNRIESAWGTDPHDAASFFNMGIARVNADTLGISVPALFGKRYQLQGVSILGGMWQDLGAPVTGTGAMMEIPVGMDAESSTSHFYRISYAGEEDVDEDGLGAFEESLLGTSDSMGDSDLDQVGDYLEFVSGLNPALNTDSEPDGLPDDWEMFHHNSLDEDGSGDTDLDGRSNADELLMGTSPRDFNPESAGLYIDRIAFNHAPSAATTDALNIRDSYTAAITVPEYVSGGQNKAAAYTRDSPVSILVRIRVGVPAITSLSIKGISDDADGALGDAVEKTVFFTGGVSTEGSDDPATPGIDESEYVEFTISGNTPDGILRSEEAWKWVITGINQDSVPQKEFDRTSGHRVYTLWDEPIAPWNQTVGSDKNPWVSALEFATTANVTASAAKLPSGSGRNNTDTLTAITTHIFANHGLSYDINGGSPAYAEKRTSSPFGVEMDLTGYLEKSSGNVINCFDQAASINCLGRALGIDVKYITMIRCGYMNVVDLVGEGPCNNPFYPRSTSGEKVVADDLLDPDRTLFGNHAVASLNDGFYDAILGPITGIGEQQYIDDMFDNDGEGEENIHWLIASGIFEQAVLDVY